MTGDEIRDLYLHFFEEKGHTVIPSSSLVPYGDPTLLLTSAGMVQIKPFFLGEAEPPNRRLASCQKCFRTTDIDCVGDANHLTFFEMLGNFSVGDYFKKEAIGWAWEFVTERLKLPAERLWITVFQDDDEAYELWRKIGIPPEKIVRCGEKSNFWGPAGESGPCGPCSEIHYDLGADKGCGKAGCAPNCDCSRFLEVWNLVFTQYNQDRQGNRTPLPRPNIDTGMGLERTAWVMQGKSSAYETDLFMPIIDTVCKLAGKKYDSDAETRRAIRVVAEHGRAVTFLIGDGVVPSNDGRGYVLRRIIRRSGLFGHKLGLNGPFLGKIADTVIGKMGKLYPELSRNRELILKVIEMEEEKFGQTLEAGLNWMSRIMETAAAGGAKNISGEDMFKLYDTYGFPKELAAEVAAEQGFTIDMAGFNREMDQQRERARASKKFGLKEALDARFYEGLGIKSTAFVGYEQLKSKSVVLALVVDNKGAESIVEGQEGEIILLETPFYGEMGGQAGDSGVISSDNGVFEVTGSAHPTPDLITHRGKLTKGRICLGDVVEAAVDERKRSATARNHTATHLLQASLRSILGSHVAQAGSLVDPDRLRFAFSHFSAISKEQLLQVQRQVNERVRANMLVTCEERALADALKAGATALFGEKYGDVVRMVQINKPPVSLELCGGTHIRQTGDIGLFVITSESSIGSGVRRIEAVTGEAAEELAERRFAAEDALAARLNVPVDELGARLDAVLAEQEELRKKLSSLEKEIVVGQVDDLITKAESLNGIKFLAARLPASSAENLRLAGDLLKARIGSGVIVLGAVYDNRANFLSMVTPDLVGKGFHAGQLVKQVAAVAGGGGGGRPEMGQAGGKDPSKVDEALEKARDLVKKK